MTAAEEQTSNDAPEIIVAALRFDLEVARKQIKELERELANRNCSEANLRESETKYRTLVESSPYCIKLVDLDGRLLSMNRAGLRMINVRQEEEIIGRHYLKAVCDQDSERVSALLTEALTGTPREFEFMATVGRYFRSNFVPIFAPDGHVDKLLSITQDVTDRRRLIDDLDHRVKNNLAAVLALSKQTQATALSLVVPARVCAT